MINKRFGVFDITPNSYDTSSLRELINTIKLVLTLRIKEISAFCRMHMAALF